MPAAPVVVPFAAVCRGVGEARDEQEEDLVTGTGGIREDVLDGSGPRAQHPPPPELLAELAHEGGRRGLTPIDAATTRAVERDPLDGVVELVDEQRTRAGVTDDRQSADARSGHLARLG